MNKLITIFLFLSFNQLMLAQTNEGTRFWFGFMEHRDVRENTMVALITAKSNTSGVVEMPGIGWSMPFTVNANDVTVVQLPRDAENIGSETISNKGILLTSQQPVSVYIHQYHGFRSEAAVVLPSNTIGNAYYAIAYHSIFARDSHHPSEFLIVANEDETNLNITVNDVTEGGKAAGTTFQITLNRGETYQVQNRETLGDLTGSFIESDKNFSLFSGNSWTEVPISCGARDNLLEQMYPIATWGKIYLTVPNDKVNFDLYRILAAEDNTIIEVEGTNIQSYNLNRGEFVEYRESEATFIQSNKPIQVVQYLVGSQCSGHSLGDPSMVLLNSIEQTRDTVTLFNSSFQAIQENFINIITRTVDTDIIIFDSQPLVERGISFTPVGRNADFSFSRVPVQAGAHTITSAGCGVIATAYGYGNVESYAYSGGASFSSINANPIPEGGCLNDTVFFDTGLPETRFNFRWDLGGGVIRTASKFTHFYPELGEFPVELILEDECLGTVDTLNRDLLISLRKEVETDPDLQLCEGESFQLGATDLADANYLWQGPNFFESEEQFPFVEQSSLVMEGRYEVIGIVSGCATFPAFLDVDILENPSPNLGEDAIICVKQLEVSLNPGNFVSYLWSDGSTNPTFEVPTGGGTYAVQVTDNMGCIGRDSVELIQQCPTVFYIPNVFSPNQDGQNDAFRIFGEDISSMNLTIFNRWGVQVFKTNDINRSWDGNFQGQAAPEGVYIFQFEYTGFKRNGDPFSDREYGTVTLVR